MLYYTEVVFLLLHSITVVRSILLHCFRNQSGLESSPLFFLLDCYVVFSRHGIHHIRLHLLPHKQWQFKNLCPIKGSSDATVCLHVRAPTCLWRHKAAARVNLQLSLCNLKMLQMRWDNKIQPTRVAMASSQPTWSVEPLITVVFTL